MAFFIKTLLECRKEAVRAVTIAIQYIVEMWTNGQYEDSKMTQKNVAMFSATFSFPLAMK
jgi:hypothetical protein